MIEVMFTSLPVVTCSIGILFVALQLHERREKSLKWLLLFFVAATLLYAGHFVYFHRISALSVPMDTVYCMCNLAVYPLFMMYVIALTGGARLPRWLKPGWLLLPSLLVGLVVGLIYALMPEPMRAQFIDIYLYADIKSGLTGLALAQVWVHEVAHLLFAVLVVIVLVVSWRSIRAHDHYVRASYADAEDRTLSRLPTLMLLLAVVSVVSFVANMLGRNMFVAHPLSLIVPSVVFSVLLLGIIYVGIMINFPDMAVGQVVSKQEIVEEAEAMKAVGDVSVSKSSTDEEPLKDRLMRVLQEDRLYLKHDLKIVDLAQRLNTNRLYIYQAINEEMGTSFSALVNRMRIDHALELMREHPDMPVAEVAEISGYRSQASFFRNFKQICGCSPKNYRF